MSRDITSILDGWGFQPNEVTVRMVAGDDGREKIQIRLDLGLLQFEVDGRPDGLRPEGAESWLDYYTALAADADRFAEPFRLSHEDCERLLREGIQYYHRYVSFWHLERYDLCARDTSRNLRLFAFVKAHAEHDRDKLQFDQWRPYVTMIHTRAVATPLVQRADYEGAIEIIDVGIEKIEDFLREYRQEHRADQCGELTHLKRWREELEGKLSDPRPRSVERPLSALRDELALAVDEERFEDAVQLRDEILRRTGGLTDLRPGAQQM